MPSATESADADDESSHAFAIPLSKIIMSAKRRMHK